MRKLWYVLGPMIAMMVTFAVVIGTATALLSFYKIVSESASYAIELLLTIPTVIYFTYSKYDPQKRWESYSGNER